MRLLEKGSLRFRRKERSRLGIINKSWKIWIQADETKDIRESITLRCELNTHKIIG